jgi:hypothetical protein
MKPNELYFQRNRGQWDWSAHFKIKSWGLLWKSEISLFSKFSISFLVLAQNIFGHFQMWTFVDHHHLPDSVIHTTKIQKWKLVLYRSEKVFSLKENGCEIEVNGAEYYWPVAFLPFKFETKMGTVDSSTTRASYQMPLAGTYCNCRTYLEMPSGYIEIEAPWLYGRFTLLESSNKILASRLKS